MLKRAYVAGVRTLTRFVPFSRLVDWAGESRLRLWAVSLLAIHDFDRMRLLGRPWWTFESTDRVAAHLATITSPRVFEWGSGASTLWLADRAAEVHAVEHDAGWGAMVKSVVPRHAAVTVVLPTPVTPGRSAVTSMKPGHAGLDFTDYCAAIAEVPGDFDLIVIDGRAREKCLELALGRLAPRGLIVFDNVDRNRYVEALDAIGDGVQVAMTRGLTPALPYPTRTALVSVRRAP